MKKLLFINSCIRENSRTERLARNYLKQIESYYEITEIKPHELGIKPFDREMLNKRTNDVNHGNLDKPEYDLARQFTDAEEILVAAPFWDMSFPSSFKIYIEHISVNPITFGYAPSGEIVKHCKANSLTYVTTAGGYAGERPSVQIYMEELCKMFCIDDMQFYCAEALDIFPEKVNDILNATLQKMKI